LLQEKENEGKEVNYLLEMISDKLNERVDLFKQRTNLHNQILAIHPSALDAAYANMSVQWNTKKRIIP
jgi:hypothetical protein